MKKLLAVVLVILLVIAVLPFIGNKTIDTEIKKHMDILSSNGIEVSDEKTYSSYLETSKHYEFAIKDTDKFSDYLAKFSDTQLPPYIKELLEGTKFATDIKYLNLPVNYEVLVDMYPLELSNKIIYNIKKDDEKFAAYVKSFLQRGGLKYHMTLNVKTREFNGYVKDIDETYMPNKDSEIKAQLKGVTYSGAGNVLVPAYIDSKIEHLSIDVKDGVESANILLKNITGRSTFESRSTYTSHLKFGDISAKTKGSKDDIDFSLTNTLFDLSSTAKGQKAEVFLKTIFDSMDIKSVNERFVLNGFIYDMSLKNIDKDAFEKLLDTLNEARTDDSAKMQLKIKNDVETILARGIDIEIPDLSVKTVLLSGAKSLKGFSLKSKFILPPNILTPHVKNPLHIMDKIKLDFFLKISKELFVKLSNSSPMIALTTGYAKDAKDNLVYDLKLNNGSLSLNGKVIK